MFPATKRWLIVALLLALPRELYAAAPSASPPTGRAQRQGPLQAGPFELVADHAVTHDEARHIAADLLAVQDALVRDLGVPPLHGSARIYLFEDLAGFQTYLQDYVPDVELSYWDTAREGFFLLRNDQPYLFVFRSPDLTAMLRHEFVHALLNTSHPELPVWLDEGLAEYYKQDDPAAADAGHAAFLKRKLFWRWQPSLQRFETKDRMQAMSRADYAEAWCWVHFLQHGPPECRGLIAEYLADLRSGRPAASLADRVRKRIGQPAAAWKAHRETFSITPTETSARRPAWWETWR